MGAGADAAGYLVVGAGEKDGDCGSNMGVFAVVAFGSVVSAALADGGRNG
jgi:hypothetical protein